MYLKAIFLIVFLVLSSHNAFAYISVPKTVTQGKSVHISASMQVHGLTRSCSVKVTDKGSFTAHVMPFLSELEVYFSQNFTFNKLGTKNVELECDGWVLTRSSFKVVKPKVTPKPEITIHYPQGIYSGDYHDLKVTTKYAKQCKLWYHENISSPESFGTSFKKDNLTYLLRNNQSPTRYVIKVECSGDGGASTKTHNLSVLKKGPSNTDPKITSFLNGNVINGNTKLYWGTRNVDSCKLRKGSIESNVLKSNPVGYPVSVPFGGQRFELTCKKGSKSAKKSLFVPRPKSRSTVSFESVARFSKISEPLNLHYQTLLELGVDLHESKYTIEHVNIDANTEKDLLVFDTSANTLQVILIGDNGEISARVTRFGFNNIEDVHSILVTDEKNIMVNKVELR